MHLSTHALLDNLNVNHIVTDFRVIDRSASSVVKVLMFFTNNLPQECQPRFPSAKGGRDDTLPSG
jgi:hypothetical protein